MSDTTTFRKRPSVRHTRAIARDRSKRPNAAPPAPSIQAHLTDLIHPLVVSQVGVYHAMGLRERTLSLPVMVGFVLSLIWRQLGSVSEALRVLQEEGVFWVPPTKVSQQALSKRLHTLPARLFQALLDELLPQLLARAAGRKRPLPPALAHATQHYPAILCLDGSTLDGLLRKIGLLRASPSPPLAGRMAAVLDLVSQLPRQIFYEEDSAAHDHRFWQRVLRKLEAGTLLLFDSGFLDYAIYDQLSAAEIWFLTRAKDNMACQVERVLRDEATVRDQLVWVGSAGTRCQGLLRLIEVQVGAQWRRYLTNVLREERLPAANVVALYGARWRIEDAFNLVKRLLGLAYFWCGSQNGVQIQVWGTWLLYAVLIDLVDAVAEQLTQPFSAVSVEMVFRGLYHYAQAYQQDQTLDIVEYLARKAKDLGILKRKRRKPGEVPKYRQLQALTNLAVP